jgi:hypothetical protein
LLSIGAAGAAALTATPTAWATRTALAAALADFFQLLLLVVSQNLSEFRVDVLLEFVELLLLIGGEVQHLLELCRENLAGLWWAAKTTSPASKPTAAKASLSTCTWPTLAIGPTPRTATAAAIRSARTTIAAALAGFFIHLGGQRRQLFLGNNAVAVGVGAIEKALEPLIGHLVFGQFAITVFVEFHHAGDERFGATLTPAGAGATTTSPAASALGLCAGGLG